jgi:hypothetical protein
MKRLSFLTSLFLSNLLVTAISASPIGQFNITGTVRVDTTTMEWSHILFGANQALIGGGATGDFAALAATTITINDLDSATAPVGVPIDPAVPFVSFDANPLLGTLDLTFIFKGSYPSTDCFNPTPAVDQVCTLDVVDSPFEFKNDPPPDNISSSATWVFTGKTSDNLGAWKATFTSQFNDPLQEVVAAFGPSGPGFVTNDYSATFEVTAIPEPETFGVIGLALLAIPFAMKRFKKSRV